MELPSFQSGWSAFARILFGCALSLTTGCQFLNRPAEVAATAQKPPEKSVAAKSTAGQWAAALGSEAWILSPVAAQGDNRPENRWRHEGLDHAQTLPGDHRAELIAALAQDKPIVAANAAILLARTGDDRAAEPLLAAISDTRFKLPLRRAAAEAAGQLNQRAVPTIEAALRQVGDSRGANRAAYQGDLQAELLRALDKHVEADDPFVAALNGGAVAAQVIALEHFAKPSEKPLPTAVVELCQSPNATLRRGALVALTGRPTTEAEAIFLKSLRDPNLEVRRAAIAGLGRTGGPAARHTLDEIMMRDGELLRAAAVEAFAELGAEDVIRRAAGDKSWRVRLAVARAVGKQPTPANQSLATTLLTDASGEVQLALVRAIDDWPWDAAGPVWLSAIAESGYAARKEAAQRLAARWPAAQEFVVDAPVEKRAATVAKLQQQWGHDFPTAKKMPVIQAAGSRDPAGEGIAPSMQAALDGIGSDDVRERRRCAAEIERWSRKHPLPQEALKDLYEPLARENDPAVWLSVLRAFASEGRPDAARIAAVGASHPATEVRRRACEHLAAHGNSGHVAVLLPSLRDEQPAVQAAAAIALGRIGRPEHVPQIAPLLAAKDVAVRLAAAQAMLQLGSDQGSAALERLSHHEDERVRRRVVQSMGESGRAEFVPTLIRMLDDRAGIQREALVALEAVVGTDAFGDNGANDTELLTDEKVRRWKKWAQRTAGVPVAPPQ